MQLVNDKAKVCSVRRAGPKKDKRFLVTYCQAGFDPSGLQRDATDMPSRIGHTSRCVRVLIKFKWHSPKCGNVHCGIRGALLTTYKVSRGAKRKKVKSSTAEESKPND